MGTPMSADSCTGAAASPKLQHLTPEYQGDDDCSRLEIDADCSEVNIYHSPAFPIDDTGKGRSNHRVENYSRYVKK